MAASAGAWYRVGTVNVTNGSAAIVGVGSNWQNDVIAIAIGDAFTIDAKTWYEVIAVNGDTSITLDRGFEGSTDNGVEYAILRNTSGTILTRIAGQIAVQFNQKQLFLDELRNWLTSEDDTATLTDSHGIEHVVKTVNKIQELTGTAADTDKVVNSVDATAGRLTSVGWGGIGGARISKQAYGNDLLNLAAENDYNGWIVEVSVDTANKPPMGPNNLAGHVIRVQNTLLMIAGYPFSEEGNMYIGYWDGAAIDWRKQFDSFNSVNPLDYGLGSAGALSLSDSNINDAPVVNTFLGWSSGSNPAANAPLSSGMSGVRVSSVAARYSDLLISTQGVNSTSPARAFIKSWDGSNTYGWQELYTSGNTNFNEFVFNQNETKNGIARNGSEVVIELPINSKVDPTSISATGTFYVVNSITSVTEATGVAPTIIGASSQRNLIVVLSSSGSFTKGDPYTVVAEAGGVTIEANY